MRSLCEIRQFNTGSSSNAFAKISLAGLICDRSSRTRLKVIMISPQQIIEKLINTYKINLCHCQHEAYFFSILLNSNGVNNFATNDKQSYPRIGSAD
jgi:hypothetical protein